ncbi:MAG: glycosyltransferase family 4 protein, partial [Acidimicrobiales bacterium]
GTFHRSGASAAYAGLGPLLVRWARRIDVRVAVSADARHTAQSALGGDYEMLFNGVDVQAFTGPPPTPAAGPTVFFIGRHEERKGLAVLLEALTLMADPPELWVGGDGPQTDGLKARYRAVPGIRWLGRISDAERTSRMKGADVCCFPSLRGESFGLVLLEAMAAGTTVVAGDIDGYRGVVTDGADGLLVSPADPAALASALTRALSDPELRAGLSRAGAERAATFSMDRLAEAYGDLYARVAGVKKSRPGGRPFLFHSAR